jgi:nucleotide-binding universal stress UspA family protein
MTLLNHDCHARLQSFAFGRLLIAYDFSPQAEAALAYARELSAQQGSLIRLVYACSPASELAGGACEERIRTVAGHASINMPEVECVARPGPMLEVLEQEVKDWRPHVLFVGADAGGAGAGEGLGMTAESLLRSLPCPVVVVGPMVKMPKQQGDKARTVVCPVDFPDDVQARLKLIARMAGALGAEVRLVHAVDVSREASRPHSAADIQFEFERLTAGLLAEGVAAESRMLYGVPEKVIGRHAAECGAAYIVFGLHKEGEFSSYTCKSLVNRVIRTAPCSVVTFPQHCDRLNPRKVTFARVSKDMATRVTSYERAMESSSWNSLDEH